MNSQKLLKLQMINQAVQENSGVKVTVHGREINFVEVSEGSFFRTIEELTERQQTPGLVDWGVTCVWVNYTDSITVNTIITDTQFAAIIIQ